MIPPNAIKPVITKRGRDYTDIAVGIIISYGVIPSVGRTEEAKKRARELVTQKGQWISPSNLPEYDSNVDSNLVMGVDSPAIIAIRNIIKEFYGISTQAPQKIIEKVEVVKPASVQQPEPEKESVEPEKPKQVNTPVFTPPPQPPSFSRKKNTLRPTPRAKTNKDRWGYLTGYELDYLEYYTRDQLRAIALNYGIRNASRMSGPQLIGLIKSDEDYQKAKPGKVDTPDTPTKAKKPLQRSGKKIYVEGGKGILYVVSRKQARRNRLAKLAEDIFGELADEKSFELEEDEAIEEALEESKEVELVTTVKLPKDLNFINAKYMAGQHGLHDLEFESDIDRAIYFAGKQSKDFKESPTKDRVREWLAEVTHLDYNTSIGREIIFEYRKKIVEKIRELIKQVSNYLIIVPEVYDGIIYPPEEDIDVDEIDPDIASKLDELRKPSEEELKEEDKSIADNITDTINDVVGEDDEDEEDPMAHLSDEEHARLMGSDSEEDLGDVKDKLVGVLNKTKKQSSYTSNKKIFDSITANFGRLQATLDMVNSNLEKQNSLIKTSINSQLAIGELVSNQTNMLGEKFDLLLQHFERQNRLREDEIEDQKNKDAENKLEGQRDSAGVSDFEDLTKGPTQKKRTNKIEQYLKSKLTRKLYRRLPKSLRNARQRVRKLQRIPAKLRGKVANKIISSVPKGTQGIKYLNRLKGVGAAGRMAGPARYAFAGLEYSERKAEGQSELQALSGVGAGLAGASLGGGLVAAGVALLPTAPTGFGAVAAGGLILLGSILGGTIGGNVADTITKADKVTGKYETGTDITRKVENPDENTDVSPMSTIAGVMIASTQTLMNATGSSGAQIASVIDPISAQLANDYDVPITLARTNVGGSLPPVEKELKKIREKRKQTPDEELSGMEKDLLETQDPESFADKLLKMLDPEGKLISILQNINTRSPMMGPDDYDGTGIDGDLEGNIVNPMEGGVMEDYPGAKFGAHRTGRGGKARKHLGRDLVGPAGMKVVSALPGTVTSIIHVGDLPGGGRSMGIYVKHANGMETRYLHVHPSVKVGDQVKAGQQIGKITEKDDISSVAHLHFEVIVNGRHVDPEPIVKGSLKMSDVAAGKVPGLSVKAPKNPAEIESYAGTEVSNKTSPASPASPPSSMAPPQQVSSTSGVGEQLTARITESSDNMDGMVAVEYGDGFPKTPKWMQQLEKDYQQNKNKPFNPGTPKPGRGMGDRWFPQASIDQGSQIASLSRYEQESESNMVLINNQSSPVPPMPSSGGVEIIQMSGNSSSDLLKNIMLQRLNA